MTESDPTKLSTFHTKTEPQENPAYLLAQHHLQPTATCPVQPREHGDHRHEKAVDMDWTCLIRRQQDNITRTAFHWTPEGKRKRGRPKNTWRRTVEGELKTLNHTWGTIQRLAQNRQEWRSFVAALHASRHNGQ
ncbi:hypothetical protein V1264_000610 [Littorina saxatilis]|uniref:Uncharacterized protein n=1 Tax=Littorina saxatilis TaxID=31220 RepID=A0AAN9BXK9_9CAEN